MATYKLQNRGYDANQFGDTVTVEANSLTEAIRKLPGFKAAAHVERYAPGGSLYVIYERADRRTGATWNKIGCVSDLTPAG